MYTPLNKAIKELKLRRQDESIINRTNEFLGGILPKGFPDEPPACLLRQVASCRYEDLAFARLAESAGLTPFWPTYLDDSYISINPDKVNYIRMKIKVSENHNHKLKAVRDMNKLDHEKPEMGKLETKYLSDDGTPVLLPDLHLEMRRAVFPQYATNVFDNSAWYKSQRLKWSHYYNSIFALFVCHGVMFEDYHDGPNASSLAKFTKRVVEPAFDLVCREIGLEPLMVQFPWQKGYELYPKEVLPLLLR